jgi:hypothetical protein
MGRKSNKYGTRKVTNMGRKVTNMGRKSNKYGTRKVTNMGRNILINNSLQSIVILDTIITILKGMLLWKN